MSDFTEMSEAEASRLASAGKFYRCAHGVAPFPCTCGQSTHVYGYWPLPPAPSSGTTAAGAPTPRCPDCESALQPVLYQGGYLNRDQWESVRAGDWFCNSCSGTRSRSGYRYFWNRELVTVEPHHNAD